MVDFKNIPVNCHPAYCWLWNTKITREEIVRQIDEMYDSGIRTFYVLGEPENFRPTLRRTHLSPAYLSEEYIDLLYYAFVYAKEKGMYTWLYNEGGFPSGFAGGLIREKHPEWMIQGLEAAERTVPAGEAYVPDEGVIAGFEGTARVQPGSVADRERVIAEYRITDADAPRSTRTDIARRENVALFLELTHEALYKRFGEHMGSDVTMMFDDEAYMGPWTEGLDRIFSERYGYELTDYLPFITGDAVPETMEQYRACSDYNMLCGDLVRDNYFLPMKRWLNAHGMLSTGHIDNDNRTNGTVRNRYGNLMQTLRAFDVPGIDVIWSQITYPHENGLCCMTRTAGAESCFEFFPRIASSAARQQGHTTCVSESFAVYGSHLTPEEMRFGVSFQAVRGISLFNFMSVSFDRSTAMCLQYRPNFHAGNPGMDMLAQINTYSARLSAILQASEPEIHTALYYPLRSISARGELGKAAENAFIALGHSLEDAGVQFDLIDEDLVENAEVHDGVLVCEHVRYKNVFVPEAGMERPEILEKLSTTGKNILPAAGRQHREIQVRTLNFSDGSRGCLIASCAGETISDEIILDSDRIPVGVDLYTGDLYALPHRRENGKLVIPVELMRGEAVMVWLPAEPQEVPAKPVADGEAAELTDIRGYISRRYLLDVEKGPYNAYFNAEEGENVSLGEWNRGYSGEATYETKLPAFIGAEPVRVLLNLGQVRHFARVFVNGEVRGELTMPPYRILLDGVKAGDSLKIVVANTIANTCAGNPYFEETPAYYVGPYNGFMQVEEKMAPSGGLLGPVTVCRTK
ncbi:MAG: hypothetical protein E7463_11405 [Ruminococcaceae bacterium]|nr:hypothetical protein [Oscillospiraceae bacterium]